MTAFFGTCPQVTVRTGLWEIQYIILPHERQGLYVITDIYPFHLQARKVGFL